MRLGKIVSFSVLLALAAITACGDELDEDGEGDDGAVQV
jgi:hypothetical protein